MPDSSIEINLEYVRSSSNEDKWQLAKEYQDQHQLEQIISSLESKIKTCHNNIYELKGFLARCYFLNGQITRAQELLHHHIQEAPQFARPYLLLSQCYFIDGDYQQCGIILMKLLKQIPDHKEGLFQAGVVARANHQYAPSLLFLNRLYNITASKKVVRQIAKTYEAYKKNAEALKWYNKLDQGDIGYYEALYFKLFYKLKTFDWNDYTVIIEQVKLALNVHILDSTIEDNLSCYNFNFINLPSELHRKIHSYSASRISKYIPTQHLKIKSSEVFNIGYMSPDLVLDHPVGRCISGIFEHHDKTKFKVFIYSTNKSSAENIYPIGCTYRDIHNLSDAEALSVIRNDQIDLLIDLSGHTSQNRLRLLSLQAAPIQAHLLGYPNTIGLSAIQYYIADKMLIPGEISKDYNEHVHYIPSSFIYSNQFFPSGSSESELKNKAFKNRLNIPSDYFVYACFCKPEKIEPKIFKSWVKILQEVNNSILLLSDYSDECRKNLINYLTNSGLSESRLLFVNHVPYDLYIKQFDYVDLFLDTLYYSAGSTAAEALFSGTPVLTCIDSSNASRLGASILSAAQLPELICTDLKEYIDKAVLLAKDKELLKTYKNHLNSNKNRLPLFDSITFTQNLEKAYVSIRDHWKDQQFEKNITSKN